MEYYIGKALFDLESLKNIILWSCFEVLISIFDGHGFTISFLPYTPYILVLTQQKTAFDSLVRKEEIAHNKQFLLFSLCFLLKQVTVSPFVHIFAIISLFGAKSEEPKIGISGKVLTCYHTIQTLKDPQEKGFRKVVEKRRKSWLPAFSPFPRMFSTPWKRKLFYQCVNFWL